MENINSFNIDNNLDLFDNDFANLLAEDPSPGILPSLVNLDIFNDVFQDIQHILGSQDSSEFSQENGLSSTQGQGK